MQDDRMMLEGWKLVFRALMQMVYAMTARCPDPAEIVEGQEDFTRALQAMLDAPVRLDGSVQIQVTRVGEDGVRRGFMIYAPDQDEWEITKGHPSSTPQPDCRCESPSAAEAEVGLQRVGVGTMRRAWIGHLAGQVYVCTTEDDVLDFRRRCIEAEARLTTSGWTYGDLLAEAARGA